MKKAGHPIWETALMILSFGAVWVWFIVRHATLTRPGGQMSPLWQVVLIVLLAGLVVVTVRRIRRVLEALRQEALPISQRNGQHPR